jgi:FkbH-like protein
MLHIYCYIMTDAAPISMLIVADTVVDPIVRFLQEPQPAPAIKVKVGPFDQVLQVLWDANGEVWQDKPQILLVWTTPHKVSAEFARLVEFQPGSLDRVIEEVDQFANGVRSVAGRAGSVFVVSWSLPPYRRWAQGLAMKHQQGIANVIMRMNLRLAEQLAGVAQVTLLDSQYWYASLGKPAYDPKMHVLAKVAYSREFFLKAAGEIKAIVRAIHGGSRKLIICDLDNTLWGGIIGDDGIDGIKLGGHDPMGESFLLLQNELRMLKNRGVLLAICSKNDQALAMEAIQSHPEMLLRKEDFVAWRINWQDKAENIAEILQDLNLLASSSVFLDDNPSERQRIIQAFPEMLVPDLSSDASTYAPLLAGMDCFETVHLSSEDQQRTHLYQQEKRREQSQQIVGSVQEWLASLELNVQAKPLDKMDLPRAAQLLNKTNQFNLTTRRIPEGEFWDWCNQPGRYAWTFRVMDKFGDSGLTAIVTAEMQQQQTSIVDLVMSCRVMGKGVEDAIWAYVIRQLQQAGAKCITAACVPTPKNEPIQRFISERSADKQLDLAKATFPSHIRFVQ